MLSTQMDIVMLTSSKTLFSMDFKRGDEPALSQVNEVSKNASDIDYSVEGVVHQSF